MRRRSSALAHDRRGATLVEFALVLPPFLILVLGSLDVGYQVYTKAALTGALERASRRATVGDRTSDQITQLVRDEVSAVLPAEDRARAGAVDVQKLNYFNFSYVGGGEKITSDTAPVGQYNSTDCYEDRNRNGIYDATGGGGDGLGGSDDVVYYNVTVRIPRLFPIAGLIGISNEMVVNTKTLIRNQPFGQQTRLIRCS